MQNCQSFLEQWEQALHQKNFELVNRLLADDCTLLSPVAHKPYTNRQQILAILESVTKVLPDFHYTRREILTQGALMVFCGTVGDLELEGVDLFDLNAEGRVQRLTVWVRPLKATLAFAEKMAQELERMSGRAHS